MYAIVSRDFCQFSFYYNAWNYTLLMDAGSENTVNDFCLHHDSKFLFPIPQITRTKSGASEKGATLFVAHYLAFLPFILKFVIFVSHPA